MYACYIHYLQSWIFQRKYKKENSKISTAEAKIFIALSYYAVFGIFTLTYFSLFTSSGEAYFQEIQKYFVCEAKGSGSACDRSQFEQYQHPWLRGLTFTLFGLLPLVNLIFVISWKDSKRALQEKCRKILVCPTPWSSRRTEMTTDIELHA